MKYIVTYTISLPHQVEIDAESMNEALDIARSYPHRDILEDFAEKVLDYSNGDVTFENIYDEDGNFLK